jgi:heme-degrading monooxygenase HmoA
MYLRFVRLKSSEDKLWDAQQFYRERVLPELEQTEGCLFASLLQGTVHGDEYISMTMWTNAEAAERYESGGLFDRLLDESDEALQEADEWTTDLPGAGDAVVFSGVEPEVDAWDTAGAADNEVLERVGSDRMFIRMVAVRLRQGAFDEFERRFDEEVRPSLAATRGCLGAFLVSGAGDPTRVLSVSLWKREEDAVRYRLSGRFERLTARLKDTFSDLYQWKVALSDSAESETGVNADALDINGYHLVVGRKLK